ncbi:MAG: hypothetical protein A1D16_19515 [Flavihumibacter sp. CACIAM 22H1]|nr:MAG: hypothetical protein A1D16_19515 [Flavihumibacter sp. CACIAM 22H1]
MIVSVAASAMVACENNSAKDEKIAADIENYVDSVSTNVSNYSKETWEDISAAYNSKKAEMKAEGRELSAEVKEDLKEAEQKFEALRTKFESNIKAVESKQAMRDELFGAGKVGNDLSFAWVTAANAKDVYINFVNTVDKNKDRYTREDWDEIKVLYEALDNRKNEIEKDLSGPDNREIAKQKIKFVGIKAVNRITAKVEENSDSKK